MIKMPENFREAVGLAICNFRQLRGMTAAQLAQAMHVSPSTISKIESGAQAINLDQLAEVAGLFDVEPWTLLYAADCYLES